MGPKTSDWPFAEPPDSEAITLARILRGEAPLLLATHDEDDGSWQFLDGEHVFEDDAVLISLGEVLAFDPTLAAIADLPLGWHAARDSAESPWSRGAGDPPITP